MGDYQSEIHPDLASLCREIKSDFSINTRTRYYSVDDRNGSFLKIRVSDHPCNALNQSKHGSIQLSLVINLSGSFSCSPPKFVHFSEQYEVNEDIEFVENWSSLEEGLEYILF